MTGEGGDGEEKEYWRFKLSNFKNHLIEIAICVYQI
jgi:hypothetical protein